MRRRNSWGGDRGVLPLVGFWVFRVSACFGLHVRRELLAPVELPAAAVVSIGGVGLDRPPSFPCVPASPREISLFPLLRLDRRTEPDKQLG